MHQTNIFNLVQNGNLKEAKALLGKDPDTVNLEDGHKWPPLYYAVANSDINMVKLFLSKGAHLNIHANIGETPLHLANNIKISEYLISHGCDADLKDNSGLTAYDLALNERNPKLGGFLLSKITRTGRMRLIKEAECEDNDYV
ncbi:MAG: ankyrin repeat domain-containing protein [Candidatus Eremiobacterota bacterium]